VFTRRQRPSTNLIELRTKHGLSASQLAQQAGVKPSTVWNAERGRIPRNDTQLRIAKVFGLTPLDLWPLEEDEEPVAA